MTLSLRISTKARRDPEQIWSHTVENWGEDRAVQYLGQVRGALDLLAENPGLARSAEDVRPGLRKFTAGSHMHFVRPNDTSVQLVRVLCGRPDARRHL